MAKSKHVMLKGVALATLVTAAVSLVHLLKKNKKSRMLKKAAEDAKASVIAHAKRLGTVSKKSYAKIVDTVLAEYRNMKALSKDEIADLSYELKEGWQMVKKSPKAKRS